MTGVIYNSIFVKLHILILYITVHKVNTEIVEESLKEQQTRTQVSRELTNGQPIAEVVDAVPHDYHPSYISYSGFLQI